MSIDKRVWHTYQTHRGANDVLYSEQIRNRNGKCQRRVIVSLTREVWTGPHDFFGNETAAWDKAKHGVARESLTDREAYAMGLY
jgi:hypothetical protein